MIWTLVGEVQMAVLSPISDLVLGVGRDGDTWRKWAAGYTRTEARTLCMGTMTPHTVALG